MRMRMRTRKILGQINAASEIVSLSLTCAHVHASVMDSSARSNLSEEKHSDVLGIQALYYQNLLFDVSF